MPREFPEAELESIAADCEQNAADWGASKSETRQAIAVKWARKAVVIRQAIDAYRERVDAPPITRRQKLSSLVEGLAEHMTPGRKEPVDHKRLASGER